MCTKCMTSARRSCVVLKTAQLHKSAAVLTHALRGSSIERIGVLLHKAASTGSGQSVVTGLVRAQS